MKLLVVDDIPTIADGVAMALRELEPELTGLERLVAYSGEEALAVLESTNVDIVVSDIRMPQISGIDLLREIHDRWPRCKVVFLSGHDEFTYARQAMRYGAFAYVLKVEGDERLLSVVREAIEALRVSSEREKLLARIEEQIEHARPLLRQEYLRALLESGTNERFAIRGDPQELGIPLDLSAGIRLALGRVDAPGALGPGTDMQRRALYAIASVLESLNDGSLEILSVELPVDRFAIFMQASLEEGEALVPLLEQLQARLEDASGTRISLAVSDREVNAEDLPEEHLRLRDRLSRSFGAIAGAFIVAGVDPSVPADSSQEHASRMTIESVPGQTLGSSAFTRTGETVRGTTIDVLRVQLENRNRERFFEAFEPYYRTIQNSELTTGARLAAFHAASSVLLAYLARSGNEKFAHDDLSVLYRGPAPGELDRTGDRLRRLVDAILDSGEQELHDSRAGLVRTVREFVEANLDAVSLTSIADHVSLNPSYLSRLYKESTGESLSSFIADRRLDLAQDLLVNTDLLVQAIALEVGYQSTISFDRFFKGRLGMTPQEYRNTRRA